MVTAADVNEAIKAKYSGDEWRVWFEVSDATGSRARRRADAVVMNLWPSKGLQLHVFEVKVSRADFMQEMKDLTKSEAIGRFADFFWLACPVGLVAVEEVPQSWGLMELTKGGMRVKKQAPARDKPAELGRPFVASVLRSLESKDDAAVKAQVEAKLTAEYERAKKSAEMSLQHQTQNQRLRTAKIEAWIEEFEAKLGVPFHEYTPPAKVVQHIRMAKEMDGHAMRGLKINAAKLAQTIDDLMPATPGDNP
ncbi:MAG: hypothetical protein AAF737_07240 [Pseudomonadota bacterium]